MSQQLPPPPRADRNGNRGGNPDSPTPDPLPPPARRRRRSLRVAGVIALAALAAGGYWAWGAHHARAEWRLAEGAAGRRDLAGAAAHLQRFVELRPGDPAGWFQSARVARRRGHFADAKKFRAECERLGGETDATRLERDLLLIQQGQLGEADARLRATVGPDHPDAPLILEALARGYITAERWADARQACELWLALQPDHPWPWLWSGWVAERLGDAKAADRFQHALELDPDDVPTRLSVARALARQRDPAAAAAHYEWVLARNPNDAEALLGLAQCRLEQGRAGDAVPLVDRVLGTDPASPPALALRGRAAVELGDAAGAERWLRRALLAEPGDAQSLHLLVLSLRAQRADAEADRLARQLESLQNDLRRLTELMRLVGGGRADAAAYAEAGAISLRVGRTEQGVGLLTESLRRPGDHRAAHAALADHYRRAGNAALARYHQNSAEAAGHAPR